MTIVVETERLVIRRFVVDDAAFIVELVNDADWIRYIGDRNIRTVADAVGYLERGPMDSYVVHGHGLWRVELRANATPIGMCGLLWRDWLADPDIGFAFLPAFRGAGYATESARAVLRHAGETLQMPRVAAIVSPENARSITLLKSLGMTRAGQVRPPGSDRDVELFAMNLREQ